MSTARLEKRIMFPKRVLLIAVSAFAALLPLSKAAAQTRSSLDVSLSAQASSNPYLVQGQDEQALAATLTVNPSISFEDERSTWLLNGQARLLQYTNGYDTDESLAINAAGNTLVDERTSISANAQVSSSRRNAQDALLNGRTDLLTLPTGTFPNQLPPDISLTGTGARFLTFSVGSGLDHKLSNRDSFGVALNTTFTDVQDRFGTDYNNAALTLTYSRVLSARTSILATTQFSKADFRHTSLGDSTVISPMVGFKQTFGQRTDLSIQAGATFSRQKSSPTNAIDHTDFALSANLCNHNEHSSICAGAFRSAQPTAEGNVSINSGLNVSYDWQLSRRERLSFTGQYSKLTRIITQGPLSGNEEFAGASASYSREINPRFSAFASPSLSYSSSDIFGSSRTNIQFEAGVRYRFGNIQ